VKGHPNIVNLQGICWDVDSTQDNVAIWPVLVFKKSTEGDLGQFMASEASNDLKPSTALGLLQDIAKGVSCLHTSGKTAKIDLK
jgi:serine/threonine protein kinase